ncbi:MAG: hypothetical protein JXQ99_12950 [Hyphomicrobiaceae bacterium]
MTIAQFRSLSDTARPANASHDEAPLQAYVRRLHESRNASNSNSEPLRGKDKWLGMVL